MSFESDSYGHALYLSLPERLFLAVVKTKDDIQLELARDLNEIHNVQNEYIDAVFLEMDIQEYIDWRKNSGLLISPARQVDPAGLARIWGSDGFRIFLSHKSEVKGEVTTLKQGLKLFGIAAFVAHEDINPTRIWQEEIENALRSMDAFVAVMTENFHASDWTDQEVGFALARGVPVIALQLGRNPYGFLARFQALTGGWEKAPEGIAKLLINRDRMFNAYVQALKNCKGWNFGNALSRILPAIERLNSQQIDEIVKISNENTEVRYSFGFRGNKSLLYGEGLIPHLHRLGPRRFARDRDGRVVPAAEVEIAESVEDDIPF